MREDYGEFQAQLRGSFSFSNINERCLLFIDNKKRQSWKSHPKDEKHFRPCVVSLQANRAYCHGPIHTFCLFNVITEQIHHCCNIENLLKFCNNSIRPESIQYIYLVDIETGNAKIMADMLTDLLIYSTIGIMTFAIGTILGYQILLMYYKKRFMEVARQCLDAGSVIPIIDELGRET